MGRHDGDDAHVDQQPRPQSAHDHDREVKVPHILLKSLGGYESKLLLKRARHSKRLLIP